MPVEYVLFMPGMWLPKRISVSNKVQGGHNEVHKHLDASGL
jgi:hypothetical protein